MNVFSREIPKRNAQFMSAMRVGQYNVDLAIHKYSGTLDLHIVHFTLLYTEFPSFAGVLFIV